MPVEHNGIIKPTNYQIPSKSVCSLSNLYIYSVKYYLQRAGVLAGFFSPTKLEPHLIPLMELGLQSTNMYSSYFTLWVNIFSPYMKKCLTVDIILSAT